MATSKQYFIPETPVTFKDTGGDVTLALRNCTTSAGKHSAVVDRGAGAKPGLYRWRAVFQWENNPAASDYAEIVLSTSDGTLADGNLPATAGDLSAAQKSNCEVIGAVKSEAAVGSTNRISSGTFMILSRYYQIGGFNASTTKNFRDADNASYIIITPVPPQQQDT